MTDRLKALIELRDKVKAGDDNYHPGKDFHLAVGVGAEVEGLFQEAKL